VKEINRWGEIEDVNIWVEIKIHRLHGQLNGRGEGGILRGCKVIEGLRRSWRETNI